MLAGCAHICLSPNQVSVIAIGCVRVVGRRSLALRLTLFLELIDPSKGVDLEFYMVSSQLAAMNYAAHLARSLAVVETNPWRKEFRQQTDHKFAGLHGQVYKMLFTRYQR